MSFFDQKYDALHGEVDQLRRQKSALDLKMDFVDLVNNTGQIKDYAVSLDDCTCMDFSRRHKPCKHMYRLAIELGIFEAKDVNLEQLSSEKKVSNIVHYPVQYIYSAYTSPPKDFIVLDFETANSNPDSICQIGVVVVENNLITEEFGSLVNPSYKNFSNSKIHGIGLKDVEGKPNFKEIWEQIKKYIQGKTVAAYNLFFDLGCLFATLERYGIDKPDFEAFDILANVRDYADFSQIKSYKLSIVAEILGLEHNAHEALSDAKVAAEIQIYLSNQGADCLTNLYFMSIQAISDNIARQKMPLEQVIEYAKSLAKTNDAITYNDYKVLLKLFEQVAAKHSSAHLYQYCGMVYERFGKIQRALFLYKKSLFLDETMRLKTRIQKLERELSRESN